jgi:hypothetical protein
MAALYILPPKAMLWWQTLPWSRRVNCFICHHQTFKVLEAQRTDEGPTRAMAQGTRFGRREPKLSEPQAREALKRVAAGELLREIALSYAVDHSTISRLKARRAAEVWSNGGLQNLGVEGFPKIGGRIPPAGKREFSQRRSKPFH